MRKFYLYFLIPILMTLFNIGFSYAAPPINDHTQHTPLSLMPETLVPSSSIKTAAIWWLPDYLGRNSGRGTTDTGGGDIIKDDDDCMKHYNLYKTCPTPKVSTGVTHPVTGMTCQKSCYCPNEYQYTSSNCSGNKMLSGSTCDGKYNACVCKPEFQYNSSNCSGDKEPSGASCDGYYKACTIRPECTVTPQSCTYGCASTNSCGKCVECESTPPCSPSSYSWCSYHELCHGDCCTDGTYKSCDTRCGGSGCNTHSHSYSCPSGYSTSCSNGYSATTSKICSCGETSGTCYKCNAACTDTCSSKGYSSAQPSGQTCSTTTVCGSTCYYNCSTNHSHSYSCPSGYSTANSWGSSAQTTGKICSCGATSGTCYKAPAHTHSYSCPSGYASSSTGMISPTSTDKTCSCGAKSGTCYKESHTHSYSCPPGYSESNSWGGCNNTAKKKCTCGAENTVSCYKNACSSAQLCYNNSCCTPTSSCSGYSLSSKSGCGVDDSSSSHWKNKFFDECDTGCGKKYKCSDWGRCYNAGYIYSYCADTSYRYIIPCPYMTDETPNCYNCGDLDQLYKCYN